MFVVGYQLMSCVKKYIKTIDVTNVSQYSVAIPGAATAV